MNVGAMVANVVPGGLLPSDTLRGDDHRARPLPRPAGARRPASAHLLRHPAVRDRPPRQRPGRDPELRDAAVRVRGDLLHRRLPRPDQHPRPGPAAAPHAGDGGRAARPGPGPGPLHPVRPEPPPRAHRARLAAVHRHAGQLARAHADLQGQDRQPARRREPRAADVPRPAGGRHRHLQGVDGSRGQGPGGAPRAEPGDRPRVQLPLRRDVPGAARPSTPRRPSCWARTASRRCPSRSGTRSTSSASRT